MPHHAIADHHRLVAGIDSDVHVQSEGHQASRHFLQQVHQVVVAIVGSDQLVAPQRKRMSGAPPQPQSQFVSHALYATDLAFQVRLGVRHGFADPRIDLEATLHQFRFELGAVGIQFLEHVVNGTGQLHRFVVDQSQFQFDTQRVSVIAVEYQFLHRSNSLSGTGGPRRWWRRQAERVPAAARFEWTAR